MSSSLSRVFLPFIAHALVEVPGVAALDSAYSFLSAQNTLTPVLHMGLGGDSLLDKLLASKTRGSEFNPQNPRENARHGDVTL